MRQTTETVTCDICRKKINEEPNELRLSFYETIKDPEPKEIHNGITYDEICRSCSGKLLVLVKQLRKEKIT